MIFVSIASYKDLELPKTIKSLFDNAFYKNDIVVGLCWQYGEDEDLNQFNDHRIKAHKVAWKDVGGSVCWARHLIQEKFYNNERWYFQVDSHTQFAENWDRKLIEMYQSLPTRGVISVGPPYYHDMSAGGAVAPSDINRVTERNGMFYENRVRIQKLDTFGETGYMMFGFLDAPDLSTPIRARHISAALLFATNEWVNDVPYDPNLYFQGEEGSLALRSYTNGYDLYNPNDLVIWHLNYHFPTRPRHWNTFSQDEVSRMSKESDDRYQKIMRLDGGFEFGKYGLGRVRSQRDWEIYSGMSYTDCVAHPDVWNGIPPNPVTIKDWDWWESYKANSKNENS